MATLHGDPGPAVNSPPIATEKFWSKNSTVLAPLTLVGQPRCAPPITKLRSVVLIASSHPVWLPSLAKFSAEQELFGKTSHTNKP